MNEKYQVRIVTETYRRTTVTNTFVLRYFLQFQEKSGLGHKKNYEKEK